MNIRQTQHDAMLMGLILAVMTAGCALVGGLGIVNYLNGHTLKAVSSLVLPAYIAFWAWQARDRVGDEPMVPVFLVALLCGVPLGLVAHKISQTIL
ncbi:hypothetical protein D3C81_45700 [compost metagenome]